MSDDASPPNWIVSNHPSRDDGRHYVVLTPSFPYPLIAFFFFLDLSLYIYIYNTLDITYTLYIYNKKKGEEEEEPIGIDELVRDDYRMVFFLSPCSLTFILAAGAYGGR